MTGLSPEQERQIKELLARDQKIAAIKLYREATGSSLKDAKDAVEAMELGEAINSSDSMQTGSSDAFLESRIKRLLAERKKIEAVKAYREAYNCGLKEAKDAVDAIEIQMRMGGYSSMLSTSTVSNDPFAEEAMGNRRRLIIFVTLLLIAFSVFIIFFVLR